MVVELRDRLWLLGASATVALSQILLLVTLMRVAGGLDVVGTYGLGAAIVAVFRMGTEMGLRHFISSEPRLDRHFATYWRVRRAGIGLSLLGSLLVSFAFARSTADLALMLAVIVLRLSESAADAHYGACQRLSDARGQAILMIGRATLPLVAFFLTALLTRSAAASIAVGAIVAWAWFFTAERRWVVHGLGNGDESEEPPGRGLSTYQVLVVGLPVGAAGLMSSAGQALPRLVLETSFGREMVGIWVAVYALAQAIGLFNQAALSSVTGWLGRVFEQDGPDRFARTVIRVVAYEGCILAVLLPATYIAAPFFLREVYGEPIDASSWVLILVLSSKFLDSMKSYLKFAHNVRRDSMPLLVTAAVTLVSAAVIALTTIPAYGLLGAASTVLAASFVSISLIAALFWARTPASRKSTMLVAG